MFLPGAIQCVAAMLWWLLELAARSGILSLPVADALPGSAAHIPVGSMRPDRPATPAWRR